MSELLHEMKSFLGEAGVLEGARAAEAAQSNWSSLGTPLAVLRPSSTSDVSRILRLCHAQRQPVVAWGGKTGLVEGANADGAFALSLDRMNRIEEVDTAGATMTVEAGCILQNVAEAAEAQGLFFPLDLGARGSATIGGNISTNAGGNRVIRYGMMREMVLGLEAVLADGTTVSSLNRLLKNNAGYDLKQLFIGTEGTLGIVTRAVLRLRPRPQSSAVAFAAVDTFAVLPRLLRHVERDLSGGLSAFEVMWEDFYRLVTTAPAKGRAPIGYGHPYYVLIEQLGSDADSDMARFERVLGETLEQGIVADAVIAKSQGERSAIWSLRDDVGQCARNRPIFTFDVSLPIVEMESYVETVRLQLNARWADKATLMVFGHVGDCNLHLITGVGDGSPDARHAVESVIYGALEGRCGSVSAEHGIGLEKREYLALSRSEAEIALMRQLKRALDPRNILNPGKIFEA
ncbi:MAG TPA: FAD-binding oxidoreductase [Rhizomicrobium sp.]|jgi:FAD/FMN-containing dehydrogenase|nr:FAD-binding oxidoreductase [Rhizomicrobium sp.]